MKNNQHSGINNIVSLFLRKMIIIYLIIISILLTYISAIHIISNIYPLDFWFSIFTIQHLIWLFVFILYKNSPIEPLIIMYISYIIITLFPLVGMYWNSGHTDALFFYLLAPVGIIAFLRRKILPLIFLTLVVMLSVFFFSRFFPQIESMPFSKTETNIRNILSIVALFAFFVIVYVKRVNIEEAMQAEMIQVVAENEEDLQKDKALYNYIIEYIENNLAFKNPNFNAHALAKALNTNIYYISRALNTSGCDFPTLINKFRINYVKSMLDNGAMKKYTIDFIYTEAGYKYRSTFNKSFKRITGMTPSEYVSLQKYEK